MILNSSGGGGTLPARGRTLTYLQGSSIHHVSLIIRTGIQAFLLTEIGKPIHRVPSPSRLDCKWKLSGSSDLSQYGKQESGVESSHRRRLAGHVVHIRPRSEAYKSCTHIRVNSMTDNIYILDARATPHIMTTQLN